MPVQSADEARIIAEQVLDHMRPDLDFKVAIVNVAEHQTCWTVTYQNVAYLETGNIGHALAGNGPIIINRRTGEARHGLTSEPVETQLDPK